MTERKNIGSILRDSFLNNANKRLSSDIRSLQNELEKSQRRTLKVLKLRGEALSDFGEAALELAKK